MPLSLAFHQTLSILASSGELKVKDLASRVLSLPPLSTLDKDVYRALLISMAESGYIEMTEEKGLIIGLAGERIINSYKFYAVFKDSEDFTVRAEADEIGTITTPPPVGDRFALAGRVWEVLETDLARHLIYVKAVEGKMEISWPGESGEIHTRILEKMREILFTDTEYPYLQPNAAKRLSDARALAQNTGMANSLLVHIGGLSYCLFPWLGTRAFRTLKRYLSRHADALGISDIESAGCCYITFKARQKDGAVLLSKLGEGILRGGIDPSELVTPSETPVFEKYDDRIPPELLRRAFAEDRLCPEEVIDRLKEQELL